MVGGGTGVEEEENGKVVLLLFFSFFRRRSSSRETIAPKSSGVVALADGAGTGAKAGKGCEIGGGRGESRGVGMRDESREIAAEAEVDGVEGSRMMNCWRERGSFERGLSSWEESCRQNDELVNL